MRKMLSQFAATLVALCVLLPSLSAADKTERRKTSEDFFREGVEHLGAGRLDEAISSFQFCVQYKDDQKECWYNLGVAFGRQRAFAKEASSYEKAVSLEPNYGRAWFNLGVVYEDLGQADKALRAYERAIAAQPTAQDARLNRAMLLLAQKQVDEAIRAFEAAIKVKDDNPEAWFDLAEALDIKAERLEEPARTLGLRQAVSTYYKAIHLDPKHYRAFYNIGLVQHRMKDYDSEVAAYRKCLALRPNYSPALYNMAFALRDKKDLAGARAAFEDYLKIAADKKHEARFKAVAARELQKLQSPAAPATAPR